jgi:hypothetical protein
VAVALGFYLVYGIRHSKLGARGTDVRDVS